ncbi:MAG: hypothetical protein AB7R89_16110 [Dehalococcoidia bacterium]
MIAGPAFVTPHAIHQFCARIAPLSVAEARAVILAGLRYPCAVRFGRLRDGRRQADVGVDDGRYQFVVSVVSNPNPALLPAVVTVVPASKGRGRPRRRWDQGGWRRVA